MEIETSKEKSRDNILLKRVCLAIKNDRSRYIVSRLRKRGMPPCMTEGTAVLHSGQHHCQANAGSRQRQNGAADHTRARKASRCLQGQDLLFSNSVEIPAGWLFGQRARHLHRERNIHSSTQRRFATRCSRHIMSAYSRNAEDTFSVSGKLTV